MTSPIVVLLCDRLLHDTDVSVREIARRCLASYTEDDGMRFARLTSGDEARLAAAAKAARESDDLIRAALLDQGVKMVGVALRGEPKAMPVEKPLAKRKSRASKPKLKAEPVAEPSASE
jgi:hypothetical protein